MTGTPAVRALVVDDDPSLIGEYRQVLCVTEPAAQGSGRSIGELEYDLFGAAVGHQYFPTVEVASFRSGEEAVDAARRAADDERPFLVAFIDPELKSDIDGIETAERIRGADAHTQIVIVAGRSSLHPIDLAARVPPADRLSFLKKPFHPFEIQQIVISCRRRSRAERWERPRDAGADGDNRPAILQAILDRIPAGVLVFDRRDQLVAANAEMRRLFDDVADAFIPGAHYHEIRRQLGCDGPTLWSAASGSQIWRHRGSRWALVTEGMAATGESYCVFCDVTEHKHRYAAHWRSLGSAQLTQVFSGLCDTIDRLLVRQAETGGIDTVLARLRTVARQQRLTPRVVDLSRYLGRAARRFRRRLPGGIDLEVVFDAGLWSIKVDPDGLAQALAELMANACDAMPNGGRIIVEAANVRVAAGPDIRASGLAAGDYVRISVQDTGQGMAPEVADQALVPFQSQRDGQHFGLGLPIVHAFAIGSGGSLELRGGAGSGVNVGLYLPKAAMRPGPVAIGGADAGPAETGNRDAPHVSRRPDSIPSKDLEPRP